MNSENDCSVAYNLTRATDRYFLVKLKLHEVNCRHIRRTQKKGWDFSPQGTHRDGHNKFERAYITARKRSPFPTCLEKFR